MKVNELLESIYPERMVRDRERGWETVFDTIARKCMTVELTRHGDEGTEGIESIDVKRFVDDLDAMEQVCARMFRWVCYNMPRD